MAKAILSEIRANKGRIYVYILKGPSGTPFYVGVGRGRRIFDHEREARTSTQKSFKLHTIRKIWADGGEISKKIVKWFDDWKSAIAFEVELIAKIGRRDKGKGPLTNCTDGGEGVVNLSEESKERLLVKVRAFTATLKGKPRPPQVIEKMKEGWKNRLPITEETKEKIRLTLKGRPIPDGVKRRMSEAHKGLIRSAEHCKNLSKALSGKPLPTEHCKKLSEAHKGIRQTEESKRKISATMKGRKKPPETIARMREAQRRLAAERRAKREKI